MGIGFFAPLPLAMMLPFMAGQSMIMGESFGKGFQYGKRKISSMSNEQFNKMDANQLGKELLTDYTQIIPHLEQAVRQSSQFQQMIIQELIKIIPNFVDQLLGGSGDTSVSPPGGRLPPAGIPAFLTPIIGPPPQTIIDNPVINPPTAPAKQFNAVEQFASRWITPPSHVNLTGITFQEVSYLIQQRTQGNLFPEMKTLGSSLLVWYNKLKPITKTPSQAITESGAAGDVKRIATEYNELVRLMADISAWTKSLRLNPTAQKARTWAAAIPKGITKWLALARKFNQYVQSIRRPNLTVDTAKSLQNLRVTPK